MSATLRRGAPRALRRLLALWLGLGAVAWAGEPPATPAAWQVSPDGASVQEPNGGLVWSRCVEGMRWDGHRCVGEAARVTHKQALTLAGARRQADGLDWHLPRVTDLRRLAQASGPGGAARGLMPGAPDAWLWSGSARVESGQAPVNQYNYGNIMRGQNNSAVNRMGFLHGWAVDMASGEAHGDVPKRTARLAVRLVRAP